MEKINFTKADQIALNTLAGEALFKGITFKSNLGTEQTIYDMIHNCTIKTLDTHLDNTKKQIDSIKGKSRWSLTSYQQNRAKELEKRAELIELLIGYKYWQEDIKTVRAKLTEAKAIVAELEENAKTPQDRLKAAQEAVAKLELETQEA